jgi:Formyl transferase
VKITVFTANQPRHIALVERLSHVASELFAIHECSTIFPGETEDFYHATPTMNEYFTRMTAAEHQVFGPPAFGPRSVRQLLLRAGDLNRLDLVTLEPALSSDAYVVFGASYIRGWLAEALVERRCINLHMGISPYYRGAATNFWALYDGRPEYVGATIHLLSEGLDCGPILFHALPAARAVDPFRLGMDAVSASFDALIARLSSGELWSCDPVLQDRSQELRYSRRADFTDEVAQEYLGRLLTADELADRLHSRDPDRFVRPYTAT